MSANGRSVVFVSFASDLVENDTNNTPDLFIRDLQTGTTKLINFVTNANYKIVTILAPSISGDGRRVAFYASSWYQTPSKIYANETVYLWEQGDDLAKPIIGFSAPAPPIISGDGRFILFGVGLGQFNLFSYDIENQTNVFVDTSIGFYYPGVGSVSADGRYVSYLSLGTNFQLNAIVRDMSSRGRCGLSFLCVFIRREFDLPATGFPER